MNPTRSELAGSRCSASSSGVRCSRCQSGRAEHDCARHHDERQHDRHHDEQGPPRHGARVRERSQPSRACSNSPSERALRRAARDRAVCGTRPARQDWSMAPADEVRAAARQWTGRRRRGRTRDPQGTRRSRGAAGAPPEVRRLVLPQGQAGPGRARHRDGGPRGARGDRRRDPAGPAAAPPAVRRQRWSRRRRCTTGSATSSATTTSRTFQANDEVDRLGWFRLDEAARERLTYLDDVALLDQYRRAPQAHRLADRRTPRQGGEARPPGPGTDPLRPLTDVGAGPGRTPLLPGAARVRRLPGRSAPPAPAASRRWRPYAEEQVLPLEEPRSSPRRTYDDRPPSELVGQLLLDHGADRAVQPPAGAARACSTLLGIDEEPLRRASWSSCTTARAGSSPPSVTWSLLTGERRCT